MGRNKISALNQGRENFFVLGLLLLFWGWMFISSLYSVSIKYKYIKSSFFLLNILLFAFPMWVPLNYKKLFIQMITIATVLEPILFIFIPLLLFGDVEGSKAYYLALGEISGIILLFYFQCSRITATFCWNEWENCYR